MNTCEQCEFFSDPERREYFRFLWGAVTYDVSKGYRLADGREPEDVSMESLAPLVDYPPEPPGPPDENGWRPIKMDMTKVWISAEHVDHLTDEHARKPILIAHRPRLTESPGLMVIDGHHRIARGIRDKRESLMALILTEEESRAISQGDRAPKKRRRKKATV